MNPFKLIGIVLLLSNFSFAQSQLIKGKITDTKTGRPLAFVNVTSLEQETGTATDIDGFFRLNSVNRTERLIVSQIGYQTDTIDVQSSFMKIEMVSKTYSFEEVRIYPGVNPAEEIMKRAIQNKKQNDPENREQYSCKLYDKVIYAQDRTDSVGLVELDTAMMEHLKTHHLFLAESVVQRSYKRKGKIHDRVIGNRVSGLSTPEFALSSTELQPFSPYQSYLKIADKSYLGPLVVNSWKKYLFIIEDTLFQNNDTTFVLSFRPKKGKQFEALKGFIHINTSSYAVEKIIAENFLPGNFSFVLQQSHQQHNGGVWFPEQLNFKMIVHKGNLIVRGETYIRTLDLAPQFDKKEFGHIAYEIEENAHKQSEQFWDSLRVRPLDEKDRMTFQFNDSIGKVYKLDQKLKYVNKLVSGKLGVGPIDLRLNRLFGVDNYEGFKLGIGAETNEKLLKWASVGGYYRYGFKDKGHKYGVDFSLHPFKEKESKLVFSYTNDLETPGRLNLLKENGLSLTRAYLNVLSDWKNEVETYSIAFNTRFFEYGNVQLFGEKQSKNITNDYRFIRPEVNGGRITNRYRFTKAGVRLRYAYGEKFMKSFGQKISLGTRSPVFYFNYTKAFDGIENGEFDYQKIEAKVFKKFKSPILGEFEFSISGGWVNKDLPLTEMFIPNATYVEGLPLEVPHSFQTMRYFEFAAQEFIQVFYRHKLWRWYMIKEISHPEFIMSHGAGWGKMNTSTAGNHRQLESKDFRNGFFESGLLINNLFRANYDVYYYGIGFGAFYRYGDYAFDKWDNNLAYKLSVTIEL